MPVAVARTAKFKRTIWEYYRTHGRDLPWRRTRDPYKILVSEVMLQQTQVSRVVSKYEQFIAAFPNFPALAKAPVRDVLAVWQGMGYNRRALYLKRCAGKIVNEYGGLLPSDPDVLATLPGIGPATAASIAAFAFNRPMAFIETNIRTVFINFFFRDGKVHDRDILPLVEKTLDRKNPREWYYALMDYGSMLKKSGNAGRRSIHYKKQSRFKGSTRQLRGMIVKLFTGRHALTVQGIARQLNTPIGTIRELLVALEREGFIRRKGSRYGVA